jgi:membrane protease YdiL (CAAX protease family)
LSSIEHAKSNVRQAPIHEMALVLGLPTITFVAASLPWLHRSSGHPNLTDARLLKTLLIEAVACALFLPLLWRRGWTPSSAAGSPDVMDVLRGGLVWLCAISSYYVVFLAVLRMAPAWATALQTARIGFGGSMLVGVAVAILNPLFEEFLWLGYGISALRPRVGLSAACIVSVALRVSVHAYQGPMALVGVAPMAIVFTCYYARTGRLWPVVVAHVIADASAFGALAAGRH